MWAKSPPNSLDREGYLTRKYIEKMKHLFTFFLGALILGTSYGQCPKGSAAVGTFDASTLTVGVRTEVTQTVWGGEYAPISNAVPGATYRVDLCEQTGAGNAAQNTFLTVFEGTNTNVIGFNDDFCGDDAQLDFVVPAGVTTLHPQVNTNACGNYATNNTMHITLVTLPVTCTDPDVPTVTASSTSICPGGSTTLDWAGANLNSATNWHIYTTNCGSGQLTSQAGTSLVVSPASTTTYYIRGEDGAGCVDESTGLCGSITITVSDAVNPTITCPGNQTGNVDASCLFSLPDYTSLATASDNCTASPTVTQSPAPGTNVGVGTTVVTLTATDGSSNTANCNFNVVVSDVTNPTITCPGNQTGNVDASCLFSLPDYTSLATANDNCPGVTVTQVPAPGTNVGVGTTNIVLTATDGASNTSNCNFDVVVSDATNPTITCPGNQTGTVDASCNFSLPDYTSLATANDNCPGVTVTQVPAPGTNVGVGTTNIVLTATDGASNTSNCNFDVVVSDATNPTITCPGNQTGNVDASCNFSLPDYTSLATASDNCPGVTVTQVPAPGTIVGIGTTNIVLTATDGGSNTANCNFDVVVSDATNPTITCPGNQTGTVDASCVFSLPDYTSLATASDNCPGVTVTQVPAPGTNVGAGTTNIVLTATDGASNTANCNFDVVVSDATNPTITCPGNQTGTVDASCNFSLPDYTSLATASDNCPGVTVTQVPAPGTNVGVGTTNIVLTATDGGSNTANCNFDVVVSDATNPTISCPGNQTGNVDASCNFSLPDYTSLATANDNCPGVTVTQVPAPGTVVGIGTTNIVLTATDGGSNTANCNFDVVVSDATNPTISCPGNQTETPDASCQFTLPDYTSLATVSDNCTASPTVTQSPAAGTVISSNTTITLTATDASSNTADCQFDVILNDNSNPTAICQNINAYLDGAGNATITAADIDGGSSDNCGIASLSASQTAFTCADLGANNVTLTVTDGNSNSDNCVAVVTVLDTISPTVTCPGNQTETPNASCQFTLPDYTGLATATDNCTASPTITQSPAAGTVISGTTTITLTADDGNGNTNDCTFDVTLVDGTAPTAVCQNITVYLDGAGNATITAADIDGGSTDNCSGLTLSASQTAFTCADIGANNVTLTATDGNSNSDNCVAVVTIMDTISPVAVCQNITAYLDGSGNATIVAADIDGGSTDNCGSVTLSASQTAFTCADLGANNVTLTVTDGNTNSSNCVSTVTVMDTISPSITCPGAQSTCSTTLPDYTGMGTTTDNCDASPVITQSPAAGSATTVGAMTIVLTSTDAEGNSSSCSFTLTVNPEYNETASASFCAGDTYTFGTQSLTTAGTYTEVFTSVDGCDSTVVLTLTENPVYNETASASFCAGDTYTFGTQSLTAAGTYTEVFTSVGGCDSTVVLTLTENPVYNETTSASFCAGDTYTFGTQSLTAAGTYTEVFTSVNGCDSTVVLTLTENPVYNETATASTCSNVPYVFGTQTLTASGTYTEVFSSVDGCDSTVVLTLTVDPAYNETETATICSGDSYSFGTQTLTTGGTYTEVFTAANGCDSTVVLTLTEFPSYNETATASICSGDSYTFGTQTLTTGGTYTEVFTTVDGCDSTVVLTLTENPVYNETDAVTLCTGSSYQFGTQTLTAAGTYTEVFTSISGCDSTVVLTLTISSSVTYNESAIICDGDTYVLGTQTLTTSGTYTEVFPLPSGCDSIVNLDLTVGQTYDIDITHTMCEGDSYQFGPQTLTESGFYGTIYQSMYGCDSIVNLTLIIGAENLDVTQDGPELTADNANGTYQWVDCDNGFAPIAGETNQTFTATSNGNYAVIITEAGCTDTSACYNVNNVSIISNEFGKHITMYPNPANELVTVELGDDIQDINIQMYDVSGQLVYTQNNISDHKTMIDISQFERGIYLVEFSYGDDRKVIRLTVQ